MSEALAAWNGYVFDRPRSGRLEHQRVEHSRRLAHGQRDLGCGERCALGDHARAATRRPFVVLYRSALHQGTAPGYQHHECQDCDRTPQESYPRNVVQGVHGARWFDIGSARHRRHPHHATSPLPPVPEFPARQVVGADVLPGLRWMLAPAAVAGHRLASGLRLLLRLLPHLHGRLACAPRGEHANHRGRPGSSSSGAARGRSTGASHVRRTPSRPFDVPAYLDPHERATENASPRTERGAPNPGVRTRARRWSGESGGSEGLASATTDNRPMSIESIAHQPRVPQPPSPRGNRR